MIALAYAYVFWLLLPVVVFTAYRYGGKPEKEAATLYAVAAIMSVFARMAHYGQVEIGLLVIDTLLFLGFGCIALRADRWWPLWLTSIQGLSVLSHLGKLVEPSLWRLGYQLMEQASSYPATIILLIATLRANRRRTGRNVAVNSSACSDAPDH